MTKIFLKSTFIIFGWLVLLANLLFAFNLVQVVAGGYGAVVGGDMSDKYFGISSLIEVLKGESTYGLNFFIDDFRKHLDSVWKFANDLLPSNELFDGYWSSVHDLGSFFNALGQSITAIGKGIFSLVVYLYGMILNIVLFLLTLINLFSFIMSFITGAYAKPLPNTQFPPIEEILRLVVII